MSYVVKLKFEDDPSKLLKALGLRTSAFRKVKQNILTRLMGRPDIEIIVLEFNRTGLYYGEISYGDTARYKQAQIERSNTARLARRRDQVRLEEQKAGRDDGIPDREDDQPGRTLEQLLRDSTTSL